VKRLLLLLLVAGVVYWIVRDRPTVSGFVDKITSPLLGTKAVVEESEHNRVVNEAAPAIQEGEDVRVGKLKDGMKAEEIRELLGDPDSSEEVVRDGRRMRRWTYRKLKRTLFLEENRLVLIVVR
jgi:hypothetical protein